MNIIYISPLGTHNPHLFPVFKQEFTMHLETDYPKTATHCFLDIHSGTTSYDQNVLDTVLERKIPIICFDCREWGQMRNEKWHPIELNTAIYFIRNMNKEEKYPSNVFPYDWPYFPECDFLPTSKEELFSRPYDICFTGNESPARKNIINGLVKDGRLKLKYEFRDHTQRIPYDKWIDEHRQAKLYLSCEGGGVTNERPNQLFSVAAQLQVTNNHLPANPFTDGINCLTISENPTSEEIEKIVDILADKEWLYDIYQTGIQFTKENLSGEAVANYILKIIKDESEKV